MVNRLVLQGRLARDPEYKQTPTGTGVTTFTVVWSEKYGEKERKLFMPCVAWNNNAIFVCNHFAKGSEMVVEGNLTTRSWMDGEGKNRETIELTIEKIHFAGSKKDNSEVQGKVVSTPVGFEAAEDDVRLPF